MILLKQLKLAGIWELILVKFNLEKEPSRMEASSHGP